MAEKHVSGEDIIGQTAKVKFLNFQHPVHGRIDTGATICSLHATNVEVDRGTRRVSFQCEMLSHNVITLPLESMHAVQSADGGIENRPVVKMDIEIHGKHLKGIEFNLNDRSGMEPVLIGENALKSGHFLVNPGQMESVEHEEVKPIIEDSVERPVEKIYNLMLENDIKFSDLIKYIQTKVTEAVKVQY